MSPRKKEEWIEVTEAATIISKNSGHDVSPTYVRMLAKRGVIQRREKNKREFLYLKSDAQKTRVKQLQKKETTESHEEKAGFDPAA